LIRVIGEINASTLYEYFIQCDCDNVDSILISSPGGDIGYTLAMLDDIDEHKRTTRATGICQSAAAVLATAGEGKRTCTMDTLFRFIPPAPEPVKNPETGILEDKVPDLRWFLHTVLVARLAQRLGRNKVEVYELFDGEFISSTRALELGLVDEVITTEAPPNAPQVSTEVQQSGSATTSKLQLLMMGEIVSSRPFTVEDQFKNIITYPSQSEADLSLATLLMFKHEGNLERVDADFRVSSLYRPKYDRADYRDGTLKAALAFYKKSKELEASNGNPSGLSRSEGEAPAPDEVGGYDSYAPTPTRSSGDIRIQPTAEKGETGDYIGWNF
jgi:ATP-dependent protease ClpP protease subunit